MININKIKKEIASKGLSIAIENLFDYLEKTDLDSSFYNDLVLISSDYKSNALNSEFSNSIKRRFLYLIDNIEQFLKLSDTSQRHIYLPPDIKNYYSGRIKSFEKFDSFFRKNYVQILFGIGGIGKSQFASQFLQEKYQREKIIWIDCFKSLSINYLFSCLGYRNVEQLKSKFGNKRERFLLSLIPENSILVLDDFDKVENGIVINFINYAAKHKLKFSILLISRIIPPITSTRNFELIELDDLGIKFAQEYITAHLKENIFNFEEVDKLCKKLGGHPFAIELALKFIINQDLNSGDLNRVSFRSNNFNPLISKILSRLEDSRYSEILNIISIFRRGITRSGYRKILGKKYDINCLDILVKHSLVSFRGKRYFVHDLIKNYYKEFKSHLDIDYYNAKAIEYFESKLDVKKLDFDLVINIHTHYLQLNDNEYLDNFIHNRSQRYIMFGMEDELKELLAYCNFGNRFPAFYNLILARCFITKSQLSNAIIFLNRTKEYFSTDYKSGILAILEEAMVQMQLQNTLNCFKSIDLALDLSLKYFYLEGLIRVYNITSIVCKDYVFQQKRSFYGKRFHLKTIKKAISLNKFNGNLLLEAELVNTLGRSFQALEDYDNAIKTFKSAIKLGQRNRNIHFQSAAYANLGTNYFNKGVLYSNKKLVVQAINFNKESIALLESAKVLNYAYLSLPVSNIIIFGNYYNILSQSELDVFRDKLVDLSEKFEAKFSYISLKTLSIVSKNCDNIRFRQFIYKNYFKLIPNTLRNILVTFANRKSVPLVIGLTKKIKTLLNDSQFERRFLDLSTDEMFLKSNSEKLAETIKF